MAVRGEENLGKLAVLAQYIFSRGGVFLCVRVELCFDFYNVRLPNAMIRGLDAERRTISLTSLVREPNNLLTTTRLET